EVEEDGEAKPATDVVEASTGREVAVAATETEKLDRTDDPVRIHCGAYYRDESFHTWHPFAVTRALENQIFFLSLNRAGAQYGNSVFCWPWMDENTGPVAFPPHAEALRYVTVERPVLDDARTRYSFLKDRLEDYARLPSA
ncbi:MAG: hypothetical protein AAGA28_19080, partial [Pseudomonadota bacterium]